MNLKDKSVIVTGAASGIGFASAKAFCDGGARVALNFLPEDRRGMEAVERLAQDGAFVVPAPGDVGHAGEAEAMVSKAIEALNGLDYLINNAGTSGVSEPIPFEDLEPIMEEFWQSLLSTNLVGPFRCAKAAAKALKERKGAIVNTASVAGVGLRGSSIAYAASKAGLINLTKNLARALAPEVRVNAVAPGLVNSPWIAAWPESRREATRSNSLLAKICEPEDVADVIIFLCAGTRMVNAETIIVDGGLR